VSGWGDLVRDILVEDNGSHDPRDVSASAIGGCLRASAWRLADVPFTDPETRHPSAAIGTAIHDYLGPRIAARLGDAVWVERSVPYRYRGREWTGRLDLYDSRDQALALNEAGELVDVKTCGDYSWSRVKAGRVTYGHIMQGAQYGAGVEDAGGKVNRIRWVYVHRATGEVEELSEVWDSAVMRSALHDRLDEIIEAAAAARANPDAVEREGEGLNPRGFSECNGCPFRSACWDRGDEFEPIGPASEDAARVVAAAAAYAAAREAEKDAKAAKARFAAQLRHWGAAGEFGDWTVDATGRTLQVRARSRGGDE
jgi:hypothetical protein